MSDWPSVYTQPFSFVSDWLPVYTRTHESDIVAETRWLNLRNLTCPPCSRSKFMRSNVLSGSAQSFNPKTLQSMRHNPLHGGTHQFLRTKAYLISPTRYAYNSVTFSNENALKVAYRSDIVCTVESGANSIWNLIISSTSLSFIWGAAEPLKACCEPLQCKVKRCRVNRAPIRDEMNTVSCKRGPISLRAGSSSFQMFTFLHFASLHVGKDSINSASKTIAIILFKTNLTRNFLRLQIWRF